MVEHNHLRFPRVDCHTSSARAVTQELVSGLPFERIRGSACIKIRSLVKVNVGLSKRHNKNINE